MNIYTIKNLVNGKMYVGQTVQSNAKMRWYAHLDYARKGRKSYLYDSMRKYGIENFLWEVVDQGTTIEELNKLETAWADKLRDQGITLYNNRETGNNKTHSAESIERMKVAQKLRHATRTVGGWTRRDGGAMKGKAHPGKGTKRTEEQRERIKEGLNNFYSSEKGIEARKKISIASRNPKTVEKRTQGRQKMLDSDKGIEYRKKLSEPIKQMWAERKAKQGVSPC